MVQLLINNEENFKRIVSVEKLFRLSGVHLYVKGRVLVGEGTLIKICHKKPKPRMFFLFNDILIYGCNLLKQKKYLLQRIIPLEDIKLENIENIENFKHEWIIKTSIKSFIVQANSEEEKNQWMHHIELCKAILKKSNLKKIEYYAKLCIPNLSATKCMNINTTSFTLFNEKHDCKNCESIVCRKCSKNRLFYVNQSKKPDRVCHPCFNSSNDVLCKLEKSNNNNSKKKSNDKNSKEFENTFEDFSNHDYDFILKKYNTTNDLQKDENPFINKTLSLYKLL